MFKKILIGAALLTFAAFSQANAALMIWISDGTTTVIVQDNAAAGTTTGALTTTLADNTAAAGAVGFNGSVGAFTVIMTLGTSKPLIGSATQPRIDLFNVNVSGGNGTLTILVTDTDFILNGNYVFNTQFGGTSDGTVQITSFIDNGNNQFGMGTQVADFSGLTGAFSASVYNSINVVNPFALTLRSIVRHTAAGQITSFDSLLQVPEPATLALFGAGLVFLGFAVRRRRSVAVAA